MANLENDTRYEIEDAPAFSETGSPFKDAFHAGIDKLQATFPPNRLVALLTPILFVPIAIFISSWVATHFPGLNLSQDAVVGAAVTGGLAAFGTGYKWLDGWQKDQTENKTIALAVAQAPNVQSDDVKDAKVALETPPNPISEESSQDGPEGYAALAEPHGTHSDDFYVDDEDLEVTAPGKTDDPDLVG